jgi:hypothetical protein
MSIGPRDRVVERLLRGNLTAAQPSAACLDAETLAAWVDGGLDTESTARAEAHVANCEYCQTVVASMVHVSDAIGATSSLGEPSERPWWQLNIRWLVPLLGAATAALLWMVVPQEAPRSTPPLVPESKDTVGARSEPSNARAPDQAASAPSTATSAASPPAPPPVEPSARKARPAETPALSKEIDRQTRDQAGATAKSEAPSRADAPAALEESIAQERRREAESLPAPAAPAPPAAAGALGATGAMQNRAFVEALPLIASRDAAVQWRVRNGSIVERSVDGGGTWMATEGNAGTGVLAGASPAPEVCWLVGRSGLVLVTRDARIWRRATAPVVENLVGVEATDERRATVRTAAGAAYETDDGGATWRRAQ